MRVILKRGTKGDREFPHESTGRARQRAESLGWLHNVTPKEEGETIVVDATDYYKDNQFIIEYYEGASCEWYPYGEGKFNSRKAAQEMIVNIQAVDEYSANLCLRVWRV